MKQVIFLLLMGLSFGRLNAATPGTDDHFSDQVNLSLRQVGHQLLQLAGDERSTVPPVQMTGPNEFTLYLEHSFNYDTLPQLLNKAFLSFGIHRDYQVAIKQCIDNTTILGYNRLAFTAGEVPCVGRALKSSCNNIVLTFISPAGPLAGNRRQLIPWFLLGIVGISFGFYWKTNNRTKVASTSTNSTMALGNISFDFQNQILQLNGEQQSLTFRENKLLYFLACRPNEVIARDTLLEEVWGDEGVIVGRSLDVFISRLRKLLKADEGVNIKTIHGVGYRLEV
ncbi:MAG: winged helix-turn-helix transcriptional regulator [Saprospiraceae bacterium]|nr:winged helix-turn-helix transcriptional regulator [Saprospiraceae bacterium]MCB9327001.1 winged helix-turn-helix transcriptional regulator [Lewinellaceae bacterium]